MPEQPPTVRDMVREALDRGQTLDQLSERATDPETGETASRSHFFDLSKDNVKRMPPVSRLRAVAAGLGKPYEVIRRAAIAQWLPAVEGAATDRSEMIREARELRQLAERMLDSLGPESEEQTAEPERLERF
jgi:hypothetical protein